MGASDLPEHVQANRHYWDGMADQWVAAESAWASEPQWVSGACPTERRRCCPTAYLDRTR